VPGNAGRFPVFWAYVNHLPQVVTCHRVSEVIDGGPPLLHFPIKTTPTDTVWSITIKMMNFFPEIIERSIQLIDDGKSETLTLNIPETYGPRPTKKDVAHYRELLLRNRSKSD
jgi:methionyl-tRNA formyltransferase